MKIYASVYDLADQGANSVMSGFLNVGGIFHVGIEIAGVEWSYGYCEQGSGVFAVQPTRCSLGPFKEQILLGDTRMGANEVIRVLHRMRVEWAGPDYNVINRNCVFFSVALLRELNPKLQLPLYCRALSERAAGMYPYTGPSRILRASEVYGSPEKEMMWHEAERLMREFERDEGGNFSSIPTILHSKLPIPVDHTPSETRSICEKSLYQIRYRHLSDYMRSSTLRPLVLKYR